MKKFDALLKISNHNDLRVVDVPRDGDCLYHTFIRNKHIGGLPDGPKNLRRQLVEYLESNPNTPDGVPYRDFLCLPLDQDHGIIKPDDMAIERVENVENQKELRWQRFLKKVHEGEWGGSLEILGLSQMYNVPVTVLSVRGSRLDEVEFNHTRKTKWNPVIYIGHLRLNEIGAHFVALRPCEEKAFQQPGKTNFENVIYTRTLNLSYLLNNLSFISFLLKQFFSRVSLLGKLKITAFIA